MELGVHREFAMIIDHFGFHVSNFPSSKAFYIQALKPLGIGIAKEMSTKNI